MAESNVSQWATNNRSSLQRLWDAIKGTPAGPDAIPYAQQPSMRNRMQQNAVADTNRMLRQQRNDRNYRLGVPTAPMDPLGVGSRALQPLSSGKAEEMALMAAAAGLKPRMRRSGEVKKADAIATQSTKKPIAESDVRAVPSKSAGKTPSKRRSGGASRLAKLLASVPPATPELPQTPEAEVFNPNVYKGLFAPPLTASTDLSGVGGLAPAVSGEMPDLEQKRNILKRLLGIGA